MANGNDVRAGGGFVELSAITTALEKGLNRAASKFKAFGSGLSSIGTKLGAIGAGIVAPLATAAKLSADAGAALFDMSKRTGISVERLSTLGYAADHTGASLGDFETAIKRMQKSVAGVADETEGTTGKLDELGISAEQLKGLSPDKQFDLIAASIGAIEDPTQRAAAAMKVFGRSGTAILPMIQNLSQLEGRAKGLGFVRSTESARAAKEFEEQMLDAGKASKSLAGALGTAVMPIIKQKTERVMKLTLLLRNWVRQNQSVVQTVFRVGLGLAIAGAAFVVFGKAVSGIGAALKIVGTGASVIGAVMGTMSAPFLVLIGLLGAATAYFVFFTTNGGKLVRWLGDRFTEFGTQTKGTIKGIADSLAKGDLQTAGEIVWTAMKIGWLDLQKFLSGVFDAIGENFVRVWLKSLAAVQIAFVKFKGWAKKTGTQVADNIQIDHQETLIKQNKTHLKDLEARGDQPNADKLRQTIAEQEDGLRIMKQSRDATAAQLDPETQANADAITKQLAAELASLEGLRGKSGTSSELDQLIAELTAKLQGLQQKAAIGAPLPGWHRSDEEKPPTTGPAPGLPDPDELTDRLGKLMDQSTARGTFSAAAVQGLQGNSAVDRTAKATEQTAANTKKIITAISAGTGVLYLG